ncbi:MAG: hypothetical protein FJW69_06745 [Actinobacteria bacterium]|nr:hypothetical protein [Actinomycetota bacterium]
MKPALKQKMQFKTKYVAAFILSVFIFTILNSFIYIFPSKYIFPDTLEEQLESVKKQREQAKKDIEKTKQAETEYVKQVNKLEGNLIEALSELDDLNNTLSQTKSELDRTTIELVLKKQELSDIEYKLVEKSYILNNRIASIYKNRNQDVLELLFESNNFLEFFSKFKLMNLLAQQDLEILQEMQEIRDITVAIKEAISKLKDEESSKKKQLESLVGEAEKKKRDVEGIYIEKKTLLGKTRANKEALIKMEKQLASKEAEITKKLEALRYGTAPGKLAIPARGVLTSGFGNRISPFTGIVRFHGGIDIGANPGAPVIAAAGGEVIQAEYMGGYGYTILIYHGGGFTTVYGHLSGFAVSKGQKVKQGQVIGYVGSTGFTTGPHLHFEVRINGIQKNPMNYF